MKVSVLISTFNHEKFIEAALRSVLQQSYFKNHSDFEILVSDDGSSDRTCEIIESLKIPQLRLMRQHRKGVSLGLNLMMVQAQGDFLFFLSGDDRCKSHRVEQQLQELSQHPGALCLSVPDLIDGKGNSVSRDKFPVFYRDIPKTQIDLFRSLFQKGNFLCAPSLAFSRDIVRRLGGFRLLSWQLQDFDFWLRAIKNKIEIYISETPVIDYRVFNQGGNASASVHQARVNLENRVIYRELFKDFDKQFVIAALGLERDSLITEKTYFAKLDLLLANHTEPSVREAGLESIYSRFDDPSWKEEYLALGFQELDFYNLSKLSSEKRSWFLRLRAKIF